MDSTKPESKMLTLNDIVDLRRAYVHFNQLTPAQLERLSHFSEELGEAQQIIGKILRHGYDSVNPLDESSIPPDNRELLEMEAGHVLYAITFLVENCDLDKESVERYAKAKAASAKKWYHHQ